MRRKLLVSAAVVSLIAVATPQPATAGTNAGVMTFTGHGAIGSLAWGGQGFGEGLQLFGSPSQSWTVDVPSESRPVPCGLVTSPCIDFLQTCRANGVFNGRFVISPAGANNCGFQIDGTIGRDATGQGPSCVASRGTSVGGPSSDTVTVTGAGSGVATIGWETSAGLTLPITGTIQYGEHPDPHPVAGFVQVSREGGGGDMTCGGPLRNLVASGVLATH